MKSFEKLGAFYLGAEYDLAKDERLARLVMYDASECILSVRYCARSRQAHVQSGMKPIRRPSICQSADSLRLHEPDSEQPRQRRNPGPCWQPRRPLQ